jgi:hypothetical protein
VPFGTACVAICRWRAAPHVSLTSFHDGRPEAVSPIHIDPFLKESIAIIRIRIRIGVEGEVVARKRQIPQAPVIGAEPS